MSLQVKLFGDLKEKVQHKGTVVSAPTTLSIANEDITTVLDILKKLVINETEISHIFVNGKYSEIGRRVKNGDRVGLFPRRMALMFLEIAIDRYISVTIKLEDGLIEYGQPESVIEIPEGSSIKLLLEKYKLPNEKNNLKISVNGKSCHENSFIIRDGDIVAIFQRSS